MFRKFGVSKHKSRKYKKIHIITNTTDLGTWLSRSTRIIKHQHDTNLFIYNCIGLFNWSYNLCTKKKKKNAVDNY